MSKLPSELSSEIEMKIENEGFDYWLRDGGWAFSQLKGYDDLLELATKADEAMNKFQAALEDAGVSFE